MKDVKAVNDLLSFTAFLYYSSWLENGVQIDISV